MSYFTNSELKNLGFKFIGENVKISTKASIYNADLISIGNNSRVDDFCILSGYIEIGNNCHITPMCLIAGGEPGVIIKDFVALAYGVKVFSQSDDYSGQTMTNSTIDKKYKREIKKQVIIGSHVIVGTNSVVLPGCILNEGTSIGACSLINKNTESWNIYYGQPAVKIKKRSQALLDLEAKFKKENNNDSI
ncbi:acyltransferase [Photobacterium damselae]|uniref:acyltransferase n=1 Tax=Photobacterium damselae TaxID=38293 RepID=UPI003D7E411E